MRLILSTVASTALSLVIAGGAAAQSGMADLKEIEDMRVVSADGEEIGEIEEVLIDSTGQVALSVEVGGFLDIGDRDVLMQIDTLEVQGDEFTTTMAKEEIEALPDWEDDD